MTLYITSYAKHSSIVHMALKFISSQSASVMPWDLLSLSCNTLNNSSFAKSVFTLLCHKEPRTLLSSNFSTSNLVTVVILFEITWRKKPELLLSKSPISLYAQENPRSDNRQLWYQLLELAQSNELPWWWVREQQTITSRRRCSVICLRPQGEGTSFINFKKRITRIILFF